MSKKAVFLNDTRDEQHLGCSLGISNIIKLLKDRDVEIVDFFSRKQLEGDLAQLNKSLAKVDFVLVNGEGTLHHSPKTVKFLLELKREKPKVLLNCVWEKMYCCKDLLNSFTYITVRESKSYDAITQVVSSDKVEVVPDLTFYSFGDLEISTVGYGDSVLPYVRSCLELQNNYFPIQSLCSHPNLQSYMSWMKGLELFVTGRFHGVCLAMMLQVPFLAIPSNSYKIEGLLKDCGCSELIIEDLSEAESKKSLAKDSVEKCKIYSEEAKHRIEGFFCKLPSIVFGGCKR